MWENERTVMLHHQLVDATSATAIARDILGQYFSAPEVNFLVLENFLIMGPNMASVEQKVSTV